MDFSRATWRKSSSSGTQSDCVELARGPALFALRDSKSAAGPPLFFPHSSIAALVRHLKSGGLPG